MIESELVSRTTTKIVNLDHTKEFQECMDSYEIGNRVHSFDLIALAIAFYECTCNVCLVVTKSSAQIYWQYSCKQHLGCSFLCFIWSSLQYWIATHECNFLGVHNGSIAEITAKGGRELKKSRKGQFQQSYILASLTHKSYPKPADIQITAGNYEGEDITHNTSWRKCQEVKEVSTKVVEKAFEFMFHSWSNGRKTTYS